MESKFVKVKKTFTGQNTNRCSSSFSPFEVSDDCRKKGFLRKMRRALQYSVKGRHRINCHVSPTKNDDNVGQSDSNSHECSPTQTNGNGDWCRKKFSHTPQNHSCQAVLHRKVFSSNKQIGGSGYENDLLDDHCQVGSDFSVGISVTKESHEQREIAEFSEIDPDYETLDDVKSKFVSENYDLPFNKTFSNLNLGNSDPLVDDSMNAGKLCNIGRSLHELVSECTDISTYFSGINLFQSVPDVSLLHAEPTSSVASAPVFNCLCESADSDLYSNSRVIYKKKSQRLTEFASTNHLLDLHSSSAENPHHSTRSLVTGNSLLDSESENVCTLPPPLPSRNYLEPNLMVEQHEQIFCNDLCESYPQPLNNDDTRPSSSALIRCSMDVSTTNIDALICDGNHSLILAKEEMRDLPKKLNSLSGCDVTNHDFCQQNIYDDIPAILPVNTFVPQYSLSGSIAIKDGIFSATNRNSHMCIHLSETVGDSTASTDSTTVNTLVNAAVTAETLPPQVVSEATLVRHMDSIPRYMSQSCGTLYNDGCEQGKTVTHSTVHRLHLECDNIDSGLAFSDPCIKHDPFGDALDIIDSQMSNSSLSSSFEVSMSSLCSSDVFSYSEEGNVQGDAHSDITNSNVLQSTPFSKHSLTQNLNARLYEYRYQNTSDESEVCASVCNNNKIESYTSECFALTIAQTKIKESEIIKASMTGTSVLSLNTADGNSCRQRMMEVDKAGRHSLCLSLADDRYDMNDSPLAACHGVIPEDVTSEHVAVGPAWDTEVCSPQASDSEYWIVLFFSLLLLSLSYFMWLYHVGLFYRIFQCMV